MKFGQTSVRDAEGAGRFLDRGFAPDSLLNVDVPALPRDQIAGVEVTRLGKRTHRDQLIERLDPYGNPYYPGRRSGHE